LQHVYGHTLNDIIQELESLGVVIQYQVDATRLKETIQRNRSSSNKLIPTPQLTFHRIIWNFPCTVIAQGQDGQNAELEQNQRLVQKFVQSARSLLSKGDGEIYMAHKTKVRVHVRACWKHCEASLVSSMTHFLHKCSLPTINGTCHLWP
jgi:hypothetical protein